MASAKERLLQWLCDAHAMEEQAETMLKAQASRIENYPDIKARIEQHIVETQGQQKKLESCITRLGGSTSSFKDMAGKFMATMQGLGGATMGDEIIKGSVISYAFENLEQATYTGLIGAAEFVGDTETKRICEEILQEEIAMGEFLKQHLPGTVQQYLMREETPDVMSKR